jgi:hypothetical protein
MPRKSAAELELAAAPHFGGIDRHVDTSPPESLTTDADRKAFADLILRFPHVVGRRNFRAILGTYVRLSARARALQYDEDDREHREVVKGLEYIEAILGLPRGAGSGL